MLEECDIYADMIHKKTDTECLQCYLLTSDEELFNSQKLFAINQTECCVHQYYQHWIESSNILTTLELLMQYTGGLRELKRRQFYCVPSTHCAIYPCPQTILSFSVLHADKHEALVSKNMCSTSK